MTFIVNGPPEQPHSKLRLLIYALWCLLFTMPVNAEMTGHVGYVNSLAVTQDGETVVSASWDTTIRLWDLSRHTELDLL